TVHFSCHNCRQIVRRHFWYCRILHGDVSTKQRIHILNEGLFVELLVLPLRIGEKSRVGMHIVCLRDPSSWRKNNSWPKESLCASLATCANFRSASIFLFKLTSLPQ